MNALLAFINQKGGCGKTTAAIHVAAELARLGRRVLLIDLDPQGHVALGLGVKPRDEAPGLSQVLAQGALETQGPQLTECLVRARPGLDVAPANLGLAGLESMLAKTNGREERLVEHIAALPVAYDAVLIDSPPHLGLLTANALMAAHEVIVPVDPTPFGIQGLDRLLATLAVIRDRTQHVVTPRVLPSLVATTDEAAREAVDALRQRKPGLVMPAQVRRSVLVPRAAREGKTVNEVHPRSGVARDFSTVVRLLAAGWGEPAEVSDAPFRGVEVRPGALLLAHPQLRPEDILLAGDFNGWNPDQGVALEVTRRGWRKRVAVAPGRHEYKLIVRGEWTCDPANPNRQWNSFGGENSVVDVPPRSTLRAARTADALDQAPGTSPA